MTIDIDAIRQRAGRLKQMLSRSGDHPAAVSERSWELATEDIPALLAEIEQLREHMNLDRQAVIALRQREEQARAQVADLADKLHKAQQDNASHTKAATAWANENQQLRDELTAMREAAAKAERERALVVEFNSRYLIGTPVRYWKGAREGEGRTSRTRTGAQMLSGHTAVVWVEGEGACIALSHIEPVATEAEVAR